MGHIWSFARKRSTSLPSLPSFLLSYPPCPFLMSFMSFLPSSLRFFLPLCPSFLRILPPYFMPLIPFLPPCPFFSPPVSCISQCRPGIIHSTRLFDLPSICPFPLFPPPPFMPILLEFYIPQLPRNGPCTTYHADFGRFPDQVIRGLALITHGAICSVFVVPVCNICLLKY